MINSGDVDKAALEGLLTPREEFVLRQRLGLPISAELVARCFKIALGVAGEPQSYRQISEQLYVTQERIRQVEKKAIAKIQQSAGISYEFTGCTTAADYINWREKRGES